MTLRKHLQVRQTAHSDQAGFTLVEIMVGLTIGMLATVVIMQVLSSFEAQKRSTIGGADAQTNGAIALFSIGRELQNSGYPLVPIENSALECTAATSSYGTAENTNGDVITDHFPVTINENVGIANSDSITIRYGDSAMGGIPATINTIVGSVVDIDTSFGCQNAGEIVMIVDNGTCTMNTVAALDAALGTITLTDVPAPVAPGPATIACLGDWNEITYAVNNGNLERNGVAVVAGVVNLQAQYGISTTADDNQIAQWVDGDNAPVARNRIKAVRVAVISRNDKLESSNITQGCSDINNADPTGLCAWDATSADPFVASPAPDFDMSAYDTPNISWQQYRYKVFETILPIRNVIWARETL